MSVKILVKVERKAALKAIRALDALGIALMENDARWPKKLRSKYKEARRDLVRAIGYLADSHSVSTLPILD